MRHNLSISVARNRANNGIVACRKVTVRERILRWLLGSPVQLTVLVPGISVDEIDIKEIEGGEENEVARN